MQLNFFMQAILKIHFIPLFLIYLDEMRLAIFCGAGRFKLSTQYKPSYLLETYRGLLVIIVIIRNQLQMEDFQASSF